MAIRCAQRLSRNSRDNEFVEDASSSAVAVMLGVLRRWRQGSDEKTVSDVERYTCTVSTREFIKLKNPNMILTGDVDPEKLAAAVWTIESIDWNPALFFYELWEGLQLLPTNEARSLTLGPAPHEPIEIQGLLFFNAASPDEICARLGLDLSELVLDEFKLPDPKLRAMIEAKEGLTLKPNSISNWRSQARAKLRRFFGFDSKSAGEGGL